MKKEFSINYQKKWDNNGTCYKQTVNITRDTFLRLKEVLKNELLKPKYKIDDYYTRLYLKSEFKEFESGLVFINLTQLEFFYKYLKLKCKYTNTCFKIIELKKSRNASRVLQFMDEGLSYEKAVSLVVCNFKNKLEKELENYI